jgi:hypothetical protein
LLYHFTENYILVDNKIQMAGSITPRSSLSIKLDRVRRSTEDWERGRGASKKGNPRYMPTIVTDKNGVQRKVYILRPAKK